jgi:hypothetical protein
MAQISPVCLLALNPVNLVAWCQIAAVGFYKKLPHSAPARPPGPLTQSESELLSD